MNRAALETELASKQQARSILSARDFAHSLISRHRSQQRGKIRPCRRGKLNQASAVLEDPVQKPRMFALACIAAFPCISRCEGGSEETKIEKDLKGLGCCTSRHGGMWAGKEASLQMKAKPLRNGSGKHELSSASEIGSAHGFRRGRTAFQNFRRKHLAIPSGYTTCWLRAGFQRERNCK
jgi:hypothetical protein